VKSEGILAQRDVKSMSAPVEKKEKIISISSASSSDSFVSIGIGCTLPGLASILR
jgi:hypothetical protein